MSTKKPSDFHPHLTEERIALIAQLINQAYYEAQNHRLPEKGDTRWSLGCRRYEWARYNIRNSVGLNEFRFLSLLEDEGTKFTMLVGDVPVRFKRTDVENPDKAVFHQYLAEEQQLSLLEFAGFEDPCALSWRILIEDDFDGDIIRAAFVGADEHGQIKCFWEVPQDKIAPKPVSIPANHEEGIEMKPAPVQLKTQKTSDKKAK